MGNKIRIGIMGYGNLAKGVECAIPQNPDLCLEAVFTRRDPSDVPIRTPGVPVVPAEEILGWKEKIDVLIICAGSATDLPKMTPALAEHFNVVDSFDTHARIPEHYAAVDAVSRRAGTVSIISAGWDPGLFSINRLYASAVLPQGDTYTFWGKGVSQGHSNAIRRIPGVLDAIQYTIPSEEAMEQVRKGENPKLSVRDKHRRECYVAAEEGADKARIEKTIKTMPNYFSDYDTAVHFVTPEELRSRHSGLPHGGCVIRSGKTGWDRESCQIIEYRLKLDSNPQFTASVLAACARAAFRLQSRGERGCRTVLDLAPADLAAVSRETMLRTLL